jgi:hypothetical protein
LEKASTSLPQPVAHSTPYLQARTRVFAWGALMAVIYAVYVFVFPLFPGIERHAALLDLESMLQDGRRWFAPLYVLGLLLLFTAFWQTLRTVHELSKQDAEAAGRLRIWLLAIGLLCGIILIGLYPITALDVALYIVRGRLWAVHGVNPLVALPVNFPSEPYVAVAGEYAKQVSPYGPLWELVVQIPLRLGILTLGSGVIAMKVIALLAYAGMAWLVGWKSRQDESGQGFSAAAALAFFALNPLVLLEAMGNGHNDMLMLALITLGLVLWQRGRWAWAAVALAAAALIKSTGAVVLPLFWMAVVAAAPTWRKRALYGLGAGLIIAGLILGAYGLMGPFPHIFDGTLRATLDRRGYVPSYAARMLISIWYPTNPKMLLLPVQIGNALFGLIYLYLLIQLARRKLTLIAAGFMAMFALLFLETTFRIWYPIWLIPFAALGLTAGRAWRTLLFTLIAELSIVGYYIVWRWYLVRWGWGVNGPLKAYWNYWMVMTLLSVPFVFGIPLLAPWIAKKWPRSQLGVDPSA